MMLRVWLQHAFGWITLTCAFGNDNANVKGNIRPRGRLPATTKNLPPERNSSLGFRDLEGRVNGCKLYNSQHSTYIKQFLLQVCQYNVGSSFGFGENMRDRRILALTPVECLLLPKIWLLQRNTANIWTRIQYFLEKKVRFQLPVYNI